MSKEGERRVCGWGINDGGYGIQISRSTVQDGERNFTVDFDCPYYRRWSHMLNRCLNQKFKRKHPTYAHVTVCEEWKSFSKFKAWMETMPWEGNELDKDILGDGSHYSPQTCCFVPKSVNTFWSKCKNKDGRLVGVSFEKFSGKFRAQCNVGKRPLMLGRFTSEREAHIAWLRAKAESLEMLLSELSLDEKIVEAMYRKLRDFEKQAAA